MSGCWPDQSGYGDSCVLATNLNPASGGRSFETENSLNITTLSLLLVGDSAVFGTAISIDRFPVLFAEFLRRYPTTIELEAQGARLANQ